MRKLVILSIIAVSLTACGGGKKDSKGSIAKKLESSCHTMAKMAGETPPKGACKCMSSALVESLSEEDAATVAKAFGNMKKPEDAMLQMMPLLANGEIMKALKAVEEKCDIK